MTHKLPALTVKLCLTALLSPLLLLAFPHRDATAAKSLAFADDTPSPNPYVTSGLVAMWDAEWNVGFNAHDPESPVWVDLVGSNHMLLNPASTWGDQCLHNAPNTKGAVAQYWADGAVTIECVMRIKGYYRYYNIPFVVYNQIDNVTYRGIGKRFERLTNGVCHFYVQFPFTRTDIFQASFYLQQLWADCTSFIDGEEMAMSAITSATHTIDENAVYVNAGQYEVEYYTIRLYNRELTEAERLINYDLDRLRFNLP